MSKSFPSVTDLLQAHGPMLSSDLSKLYREMGLKEEAARQRVSRRSKKIKKLNGLTFSKNAQFLYLEEDFGKKQFYQNLLAKLKETKSAYGTAIFGLIARNGICLKNHWPIVSGAPDKQKKHTSHKNILEGLKQAKLIDELDIVGIGHCLKLNDHFFNVVPSKFRSRLTIDHILKKEVQNWAIRLGWSSEGTLEVFSIDKLPQFSTMAFDLVGPCYLQALKTSSGDSKKPGFFVCDVMSGKELTEDEISGFLKKIDTLKSLKQLLRFQPMLLADRYSKDALEKLRSRGVIAATPESLFGRKTSKSLITLFQILNREEENSTNLPERLEDIFNKLDGWEGNIRGALFEMIVGHLVKVKKSGTIEIGTLVTDKALRSKADIDVRLTSETDVICYECKGHGPEVVVPLEEVKTWLEKKVPIMRGAQNNENRFSGLDQSFEFWTTGKMDPNVINYLKTRKSEIQKYKIEWQTADEIVSLASTLKNKTMHKLLKRFYCKDIFT